MVDDLSRHRVELRARRPAAAGGLSMEITGREMEDRFGDGRPYFATRTFDTLDERVKRFKINDGIEMRGVDQLRIRFD